jgi:hypothetical protein
MYNILHTQTSDNKNIFMIFNDFRFFVFDSVRVITCKVSVLYTSWMAEMNRELS